VRYPSLLRITVIEDGVKVWELKAIRNRDCKKGLNRHVTINKNTDFLLYKISQSSCCCCCCYYIWYKNVRRIISCPWTYH
jgi:hypothetical protein